MISVHGDREAVAALGERVRRERLRRNFSQAYLAGAVGITLPTYRKIEAGAGTVEFGHVAKTLGVLGYSKALGELIPAAEPAIGLKELLSPERQRASQPRHRKH